MPDEIKIEQPKVEIRPIEFPLPPETPSSPVTPVTTIPPVTPVSPKVAAPVMTSLGRVWFIFKKLGWLVVVIIGAVVTAYLINKRNKIKNDIDTTIQEIQSKEQQTEEDVREIHRLNEEAKKVEGDIQDITARYKEKVDKLHSKQSPDPLDETPPPEPKPGDAGDAVDELNKTW